MNYNPRKQFFKHFMSLSCLIFKLINLQEAHGCCLRTYKCFEGIGFWQFSFASAASQTKILISVEF